MQAKPVNSNQRFNETCLFNLALWCWFSQPFASGSRLKVPYEDRIDSSSVKANINKLPCASFSRISVALILFGLPPAAEVCRGAHALSEIGWDWLNSVLDESKQQLCWKYRCQEGMFWVRWKFEGIVHPKMTFLSSSTRPHCITFCHLEILKNCTARFVM